MNRLPILLFCCCISLLTAAQVPDFITVRKRNGRTVKHIMSGLPVALQETNGRYLEGWVHAVRNDSLFVREIVTRRYMSSLGVVVTDTLGSVLRPVHYRNIERVHLGRRYSFWRRQGPTLLLLGGAGYILLNLVNGALYKQPVNDPENMRRLATAAAAGGTGWLLRRLLPTHGFSTRRHRIIYINMQLPQKTF